MLDRANIFDGNTRELSPAYRRSVGETLPTNMTPTQEAAFWPALAQLIADYSALVERRQQRPTKRELDRWQRIGELVDELGKELRAVRDQTRWNAAEPMLANRTLEALAPLKEGSAAHVAGYAQLNESTMRGRGVAQNFLYGAILDLWRGLGQHMRYSKKASQPVGPLIRFFTACAAPLLGDDMPTARGVADIIDHLGKRQKRQKRIPV